METNLRSYFGFLGSRHMEQTPRHHSHLELNLQKQRMTGRQSHQKYFELEAQFNANALNNTPHLNSKHDEHDFRRLQTAVKRERVRWKRVYEDYMLEHVWVLHYVSPEALQCTYLALQEQLKRLQTTGGSGGQNKQWKFLSKVTHSSTSSSSSSSSTTTTAATSTSTATTASFSEHVTMQRMDKHVVLSPSFPPCVKTCTPLSSSLCSSTHATRAVPSLTTLVTKEQLTSLTSLTSSLTTSKHQNIQVIMAPSTLVGLSTMVKDTGKHLDPPSSMAIPIVVCNNVCYIESPLLLKKHMSPKDQSKYYYQHLAEQHDQQEVVAGMPSMRPMTPTNNYIVESWLLGKVRVGIVTGPYYDVQENAITAKKEAGDQQPVPPDRSDEHTRTIPVIPIVHPQYYSNVAIERMAPMDTATTCLTTIFLPKCSLTSSSSSSSSSSSPVSPSVLNIDVACLPEECQRSTAANATLTAAGGQEAEGDDDDGDDDEDDDDDDEDDDDDDDEGDQKKKNDENVNKVVERGAIVNTSLINNVNQIRREHLDGIHLSDTIHDGISLLNHLINDIFGLIHGDGTYLLVKKKEKQNKKNQASGKMVVSLFKQVSSDTGGGTGSHSSGGGNDKEKNEEEEINRLIHGHDINDCNSSSISASSIIWSPEQQHVPQVYGTFPPRTLQLRFRQVLEKTEETSNRSGSSSSNSVKRNRHNTQFRGLKKKKIKRPQKTDQLPG